MQPLTYSPGDALSALGAGGACKGTQGVLFAYRIGMCAITGTWSTGTAARILGPSVLGVG